jgi:peroxin-11B
LAWYTLRTNYSQSTVDTLNGVKKNFGAVRKAMRLTKFIEHFKLAAVASDAKTSDPVVKYLAVGRQLGYAFYMLLDNLTYPDVSGSGSLRRRPGCRRRLIGRGRWGWRVMLSRACMRFII